MTTFKAGWRIIAAHKLYMTFYVVWLCVMMVMMSFRRGVRQRARR